MPSFHHAVWPQRHGLPPTPPESGHNGYGIEVCGGMGFQQNPYAMQASMRRQEDVRYDYNDRFGHHQQSHHTEMPTMLCPVPPYNTAPPAVHPTAAHFYKGPLGPILPPPVAAYETQRPTAEVHMQRPQETHGQERQHRQQPKDEKPVGGVSAQLDYDMDVMTDFVSETAQGMFDLFKSSICLADVDIPRSVMQRKTPSASFRKWVHQVLCATRLPSSTILLSFHYLAIRMTILQASGAQPRSDAELYQLLTTSLILGSKFLDDNTFINRSWSEVSAIDVAILNRLEREWLNSINFTLHRDPNENQGFRNWQLHWQDYDRHRREAKEASRKPSPIDTNVQNQRPVAQVHQPYTPLPQSAYSHLSPPPAYSSKPPQSSYPTPSYNYDPFLVSRASSDTSPASATHTGPTTPEYYGGPGTWAPLDCGYGYNRMHSATLVPRPQPAQPYNRPPPPPPQQATYPAPLTYVNPSIWSSGGHGVSCPCIQCTRQHLFMASAFGPQLVAG